MAARGTTFGKMERERAKKAKAAAKRARREERGSETESDVATIDLTGGLEPLTAAELMVLVEATHRDLEAGKIDLDEFEERKAELMTRLPID